jgi:hypothetical protein
MMHHPEATARKLGISPTFGFRRTLDQSDLGALLRCRQCGAQRGISAAKTTTSYDPSTTIGISLAQNSYVPLHNDVSSAVFR